MAIQWMDDFTCYGTDTNRALRLLDGPYAVVNRFDLQADPDPTSTGAQVLRGFGGGTGGSIRKILSTAQTTVGVAARYWFNFLPTVPGLTGQCPALAAFADTNARVHIYVMLNPSGVLQVYRVDNGGDVLIGSTSTAVIRTNGWIHVETKVFLDPAVGTVEIRVEGFTVLTLSGIRTTSNVVGAIASCLQATFISQWDGAGPFMYIKDYIVWDGTGGSNNNFMSTCQVMKLIPTSDTALGWTASTGTTGYNLVNETTPDDDGTYISAPFPLPTASQFQLSDLPANVSTVRGVQLMHRSKKTDGGDGNIQVSVVSGANTGNGVDRPITTAYSYWWDVFDLDPSGSAWSRTLVNALQMKLNRTV